MHFWVAAGHRLQGCRQGPSLGGALARSHVATKLLRCNFPIQILYEKNSWKTDAFFSSSALGCNGASSQPFFLSPNPAPFVFPYLTLPSLCDLFPPQEVYKAPISLLFASFLPSPQQPTHFLNLYILHNKNTTTNFQNNGPYQTDRSQVHWRKGSSQAILP
ncbi:unnamed protein product [Tuber aestivum]|uniref:Uncharacterized protein n=1 Tax=Tuber aestivum TaxID=59557 RepID=A0A292Q990_9PEZI|nr:unnamed protein product [Tuber aestivum]